MTTDSRPPFSPTGEYIARKNFRFAGRDFKPGDTFPWRQLACDTRKLRQLYEGRFVTTVFEDEESISVVSPPLPPDFEISEETEEEQVEDLTFDPEIHRVDNPKRGRWVITRGGKILLRVTRKEARRLVKKVNPTAVDMDEVVE